MQVFSLFHRIVDTSHRLILGYPTVKRSQITENIFLGGQYNRRGLRKLKEMGISAIVNMQIKPALDCQTNHTTIHYLHLPTIDNTPSRLKDLVTGTEFIEQELAQGGKVYIHCRQGIGRAPSMLIAYLLKNGSTYEEAYWFVKKVRVFISLKTNQVARLKELEIYYKMDRKD